MQSFKKSPIATAVLMALSGTGAVLAEEPAAPPSPDGAQTMPLVEVVAPAGEGFQTEATRGATRTDTPLRDIPQFMNVVPQQLIQSQQAMTLVDALRNVPGITYGAAEGGTMANNVFFMRGFQVVGDIYLDGLRDLGEYNRDLFFIDSVEVLKGPSALAFGRGSPGGVINQVSKVADLFKRRDLQLTLGTNGEKRLSADVNASFGQTNGLRVVALAEDSHTYRDTVDAKKLGIAPSLRIGAGTPTDITLSYMYLHSDDITDYGQPNMGSNFGFAPPPVALEKYYGFANHDYTLHDTHIATLRVDHKISSNVGLRNTLRWANYQREMEATIPSLSKTDANGSAVTASTPVELLLVNRSHNKARDNDDQVLFNQTDLTWKVVTGAMKHTLLTGLELAKEDLDRWNYTFSGTTTGATSYLNPDPYTNLSYTKTPNQRSVAEAETVAVLLQDQLEINQHWKALLGVRWERLDSEVVTTNYQSGSVITGGGPFRRVDSMWSGRAGIVWQPDERQSYYISGANSYNPSGQLGVYGANGTSLSATNDDLEPEENRSYELGSTWDFGDGVQLRTAIFRNEKINQRIPPEPGSNLPPILGGKRRVDGIELSGSGQLTRDWDVYGSLAWMKGRIVKSNNLGTEGKEPYGTPGLSGTLWSVYRLGGGWELGGGVFGSSKWFLNDTNTAEAPSFARWDATLAFVQRKYEVRFNVLNLTNVRYYVGGYENGGNRVIPGQPLTGLLSVSYRFD